MDTATTDFVIPEEKIIIKRRILSQKSRIYFLNDRKKNQLLAGEKLIEIPAGNWKKWSEIICNSEESDKTSIVSLQKALFKQAYDVIINGKFDKQTKDALHAFQQDNLIDVGNDINNPTVLQRLGIKRKKLITFE
ncbi:peptidoglycan-binding protein [Aureispira]|nr:peptidoglycan-binding protein [Aureispira sp.]